MALKLNRVLALGVMGMSLMLLSGCRGRQQVAENLHTRENFQVTRSYQADLRMRMHQKKKTVRQLAKSIVNSELGLAPTDSYKMSGIDSSDGVFVKAGILDGDGIPKVSAMDDNTIEADNAEYSKNYFKNQKKALFKDVKKQREDDYKSNKNALGDDSERLTDRLQSELNKQNGSKGATKQGKTVKNNGNYQ